MSPGTTNNQYDLIIMGGALSGSATALLVKRANRNLRILIIERSTHFKRRVGESTVELSSHFLGKILGLNEYLTHQHLIKQGLRFWFTNSASRCPDSCSEIGPYYNVRLTSYQVDRAVLDTCLLEQCRQEGIDVRLPAEVKDFTLSPGGMQQVVFREGEETHTVSARWLIDATGVAKLVARKSGWVRRNTDHPISTAWARWRGVQNWDSAEMRTRFPHFARRTHAIRNTATNHLIGKGWWSWWIPLKGGDVSIGVVYDERLVEPPPGNKPNDRMRALLDQHPMSRILLKDAECIQGDTHWRRKIPYWSEEIMGDGFALVGDAAGFIDPFYSPGMDWISFSTYSAADLVVKERAGKLTPQELDRRNHSFKESYHRWFNAIYKDKYYYMGDYELMRLAFRLDVGLYYFGVVNQPYKHGAFTYTKPPFSGAHTAFPSWLIAKYNWRLASIGAARMKRGTWGRHNNGHHTPFKSFGLDYTLHLRNLAALLSWGWLELREGWRTWGKTPASILKK